MTVVVVLSLDFALLRQSNSIEKQLMKPIAPSSKTKPPTARPETAGTLIPELAPLVDVEVDVVEDMLAPGLLVGNESDILMTKGLIADADEARVTVGRVSHGAAVGSCDAATRIVSLGLPVIQDRHGRTMTSSALMPHSDKRL